MGLGKSPAIVHAGQFAKMLVEGTVKRQTYRLCA